MRLISLGLFAAAMTAYVVAAVVFGLLLSGVLDREGKAIAVVPNSIRTGMILNALGAVAAIAGFFLNGNLHWAWLAPLLLNSAPPLFVLGLMAAGFILTDGKLDKTSDSQSDE